MTASDEIDGKMLRGKLPLEQLIVPCVYTGATGLPVLEEDDAQAVVRALLEALLGVVFEENVKAVRG